MQQTRIVVVGEAWGRDEAPIRQPFIGASGRLLNRLFEEAELIPAGSAARISPAYTNFLYHERNKIYADAGIYLTNVFNIHPEGNKLAVLCGPRWGDLPPLSTGKYIRPEFVGELERLRDEIADRRPNLIIGLGATAVWFALRTAQVARLRGAIADSPYGKFLPTYHPAFLLRGAWKMRSTVLLDLFKAKREAEYPEIRRPERRVFIPESLADIEYGLRELALADIISIDIETVGNQITCIGFAWSKDATLVIPIFDWSKPTGSYWSLEDEKQVWRYIRQAAELPIPKLFQNGLYDIRFLWEQYGIMPARCEHDTMLLHHALQPELLKGLGFLGSIYTDEPAWKTMRPKGKGTIKREDE